MLYFFKNLLNRDLFNVYKSENKKTGATDTPVFIDVNQTQILIYPLCSLPGQDTYGEFP
jgi:hypothetical protein